MKFLRLLLLPFSLIYGAAVALRNAAYNTGLFRSHKFDIPVISIGNLAVGGAGKSPIAEYLIRLLKNRYKVAVLSRGYGRKTTGFIKLDVNTPVNDSGDEPLQFKHKFPAVTVAVCERRAQGIEQLKTFNDVIILDDAYQHRSVKAGLNLLLFDYNNIFNPQFLLPAGDLREPLSGRSRADILIITKTPSVFFEVDQETAIKRIRPYPHQELFFSYLEYGDLTSLDGKHTIPLSEIRETGIILLTGIANPVTLLNELKHHTSDIIHYNYPDHHNFSRKNIIKIASVAAVKKKLIITTEKDAQRLRLPELNELLKTLAVYYLPVAAKFHKPKEQRFNKIIEDYVAKHLHNN
jgi:tetraacyldisaccharide 4'-kinase